MIRRTSSSGTFLTLRVTFPFTFLSGTIVSRVCDSILPSTLRTSMSRTFSVTRLLCARMAAHVTYPPPLANSTSTAQNALLFTRIPLLLRRVPLRPVTLCYGAAHGPNQPSDVRIGENINANELRVEKGPRGAQISAHADPILTQDASHAGGWGRGTPRSLRSWLNPSVYAKSRTLKQSADGSRATFYIQCSSGDLRF